MRRFLACAFALALPPLAAAQVTDAVAIDVAELDDYGLYLVDGAGRPLYMFSADAPGTAATAPRIACDSLCLDRWPLFNTGSDVVTQDPIIVEALIGVSHQLSLNVVSYNGWPLYHFVEDDGRGPPVGHGVESFGGVWYLVSPDGDPLAAPPSPG